MQLTLYPHNYGFVSRDIIVQLNAGLNNIMIENIPANIDPHSCIFSFQKTSDVIVQSYEFIKDQDKMSIETTIETLAAGEYALTFFYKVELISYEVFYNFLYDNINNVMEVYGWVEIYNCSGIDFENTELQIVIKENNDNVIFTLDNLYFIENNKKINISFLAKKDIPVNGKLILPFEQNLAVECIYINNIEKYGLGTPLMAGKVSLYFQDENQNLQHIDDGISGIYYPNDEILFEIGPADDLIFAERKMIEDSHVINIKNLSTQIIDIHVEENVFGQEILQSNVPVDIDYDGIMHKDIKIMPLTTSQIVYRLKVNDNIPIL